MNIFDTDMAWWYWVRLMLLLLGGLFLPGIALVCAVGWLLDWGAVVNVSLITAVVLIACLVGFLLGSWAEDFRRGQ